MSSASFQSKALHFQNLLACYASAFGVRGSSSCSLLGDSSVIHLVDLEVLRNMVERELIRKQNSKVVWTIKADNQPYIKSDPLRDQIPP